MSKSKTRKGAKAMVMTPTFRQKVEKDKSKYTRKTKHKGLKNG